MGWVLITSVIISGTLAIAGTIIWVVYLNKHTAKIEIEKNASFIDATTRTAFTEGYSFGLIKKEIPRKNDTVYIEFYPMDSLQGENQPRPDIQSLVVAKAMLRRFPKGEISSRREVVKVLTRNKSDLPKAMRDTDEGKYLSTQGQLAHLERTFGKGITAGDDAINEAMSEWSRGNISRNVLAQLWEENQEMRRISATRESPPEYKK